MNEESLFIEALETRDPAERAALLDRACAGDSALRDRLDRLLDRHEGAGSFLGRPAATRPQTWPLPAPAGHAAPTAPHAGPAEGTGAVIGPYKLLQVLGEGGMGTVYMAEQTRPVQRKVALKLIKAGMDSGQVIARFEAERQALALMDHPNIAKVLDAGSTGERGVSTARSEQDRSEQDRGVDTPRSPGGRPYFVMELVKGVPITRYCDDHHLSCEGRLGLFVQVCQAVQHAHQKGVIHRDLKPSNVLVCLYDGKPVPKVIDFGVAKATGARLTDRTLFTEVGAVVGTLEYMSPEQAEVNQLDVDTRSDVYSLGVLLYELLTGTTSLERKRIKESTFLEVLRLIREEEPQRPSNRLSTAQGVPAIAANRGLEPKRLGGVVRGELDWIAMRALEKDRSRRYESASAFAADVGRYLRDEPVQARPPSPGYRFRKFARRNKAALAIASVVAFAVMLAVAGLAASTLLIANALQAETRAKDDLGQTLERERQTLERELRDAYFHRITLAHRELSADNLGRAQEYLDECPPELRGWEWHYLKRLCRVEPVVIRYKMEVNSLAFSPDGARLASAGGDGAVKVWDVRTGRAVRILENAHGDFAATVAFHPGGKHLASAGADRQVKVWELATGLPVFARPCDAVHTFGTAYAAAFSPDGRQLAAGSDGAVQVWDWENGRLLHTFPGHEKRPIGVAFSPDGRHLASGDWRGGVKLWDAAAGGEPLAFFPESRKARHPVPALAFSRDGGRLATASFERRTDLWDAATGELLRTLRHAGLVLGVAVSPDGRRLASAGEDKTVRVWDAAAGREVLGLRGHTGACGCVAFSPDPGGRRLASAGKDGTIRIWDATPLARHEGQGLRTFTHQGNEIWSLAFSPDGQKVVSAGFDTPPKVWDAQTGQVGLEFAGHEAVVFCVAWQPDGRRVASAGREGESLTVKVWDAKTGQTAYTLPAGPEVFAVAFSPDERHLVTAGANRTLQVWHAGTGEPVGTLGTHDRIIRGVAFSRDGWHLASASEDSVVKLWDATRLAEKQDARHSLAARVHGLSLNVAFSPDGRRLATGGPENTVKVWDVPTGKELQTLRGHSGDIATVAFSPDPAGRWIASAGEDSTVRIWDGDSGALVRSFRGHTGLVSSVAFSPDGRFLFSGSRDHKVKVWDVTQLEGAADR